MTHHIIPFGELKMHEDSRFCKCQPYEECNEFGVFYAHNSLIDPENRKDKEKVIKQEFEDRRVYGN